MKYELIHDTVASQVFVKASIEARTRRKVEKLIHDRFEAHQLRGVKLSQDDVDEIGKYLEVVNISQEERDFVDESKRSLERAKLRLRLVIGIVIVVLLSISGVALTQWQIAEDKTENLTEAQEEIKRQNIEITEKAENLNSINIEITEKNEYVDSINAKLEISLNEANTLKLLADQKTREAESRLKDLNLANRNRIKDLVNRLPDALNARNFDVATLIASDVYEIKIDKQDVLSELQEVAEVIYFLKEAEKYTKAVEVVMKTSHNYDFSPPRPAFKDTLNWLEMALNQLISKADNSELENKYYPKMIPIKGARFRMGPGGGRTRDAKTIEVEVSDLEIADTELTVFQYLFYCFATNTDPPEGPGFNNWEHDYPVAYISLLDAARYCNWLSARKGLSSYYMIEDDDDQGFSIKISAAKEGYRLPSEAEWVLAASYGNSRNIDTGVRDYKYAGLFPYKKKKLSDYAWFEQNNVQKVRTKGYISYRKRIYDMNGNVAEWCWSRFGPLKEYNQKVSEVNSETEVVVKGGSWANDSRRLEISNRSTHFPNYKDDKIGFRVVRSVPESK
ncbi:MAG: formylglycine-generating enzyme family protein [Bacteroidia bacterium]|nr:formylglycine-generating enzyme family protein [Bacteroidia bacterium]